MYKLKNHTHTHKKKKKPTPGKIAKSLGKSRNALSH